MADQTQEAPVRILLDVSSDPKHSNNVDIHGNQGVLVDVLVQIFEFPGNESLAELFDMAVEDYYQKHPDKRIIN